MGIARSRFPNAVWDGLSATREQTDNSEEVTYQDFDQIFAEIAATQDYVLDTSQGGVKVFGAVGDGVTDDTAAIQAALDAGGLVFFPAGDYLITDSLIVDVENTVIHGSGAKIVADDATFHIMLIEADFIRIFEFGFEGAAVDGSTIQAGIFTALGYDNVVIRNCRFDTLNIGIKNDSGNRWFIYANDFVNIMDESDSHGYGILFGDASRSIIAQNTFEGVQRHAIYISAASQYNVVFGNTVTGCIHSQIALNSTGLQGACRGNLVTGNTLSDAITDVGDETASISVDGISQANTISNNNISNNINVGISVNWHGDGATNFDNVISGNNINGTGRSGIVVRGAKRTLVQHNYLFNIANNGNFNAIVVFSTGTGGTEVADKTKIFGNTINGDTHRVGILINDSAPAPTGTEIMFNSVEEGTVGFIETNTAVALVAHNSTQVELAVLTAADAGVLNTGDATSDDIIDNMRTRIAELEARLVSSGVITS